MFERVRAALARAMSLNDAGSSACPGIDPDELLEERAAIMEFDGGMSRADAERLARADVVGLLERGAR